MALLLLKATDATHVNPVKDLRGCYKRGDVIEVYEDDRHNGDLVAYPISAPFVMIRVRSGQIGELANGIGAAATTMTLLPGQATALPAPPQFAVLGVNPFTPGATTEVVRITAVNGDVLTVNRGLRGTTPRAWVAGTPIERVITKARVLKYLDQERDVNLIPIRRRAWRVLLDSLPQAFLDDLAADRWAEVTWPQVRNFIQNKLTLQTETEF